MNDNEFIDFGDNTEVEHSDNSMKTIDAQYYNNEMPNINYNGQQVTDIVTEGKIEKTKVKKQKKQRKKKKKHTFLKFILFNLLLIGFFKVNNIIAEKEMQSFISDYPFYFSAELNSINYITEDFIVDTVYNIEDKEYNIKWKSSSDYVKFGDNGEVLVTRPSDKTETVTITAVYKKFLGKATKSWDIKVIPTDTISSDYIDVITLNDIETGSYNREMKMILDEHGNINYMLGDFKNTKVYSVEDALEVLNAYREQFNVPEELEFRIEKIADNYLNISYIFSVYYNDIKLANSSADISVYKDSYKVKKLDFTIIENIENIEENYVEYIIEDILKQYLEETNSELKDIESICLNTGTTLLLDNKIYDLFDCIFENGGIYTAYVNKETGLVEKLQNDNISFTCNSTDDYGNYFEFEATKKDGLLGDRYYLHDQTRHIHVMDNIGCYNLVKLAQGTVNIEDGISLYDLFVTLSAKGQQVISNEMNIEISSTSETFSNGAAAKTLYSVQKVHDYYRNNFNCNSFDGNGAPVLVLFDCTNDYDNASWNSHYNIMAVNPVHKYKYSFGNNDEVLAHEFTHAIVGSRMGGSAGSLLEMSGLNEAYADIFGVLASGNTDWIIGKNYTKTENGELVYTFVRDIANINVPDNNYIVSSADNSKKFSVTYKDEYWREEEHAISTVISHIAYKMDMSGMFTREDIGKIWYTSIGNNYKYDSTYFDCRIYVLDAAMELGYSADQVNFIAKCFDEAGIYDDTFVMLKTKPNSIDGDAILDNSTNKRFMIAYSVADVTLGSGNIVIYEEKVNNFEYLDEKTMETKVQELFNTKYSDVNIQGNDITIDYKYVSSTGFDIAEEFSSKAGGSIIDTTFNMLDKTGMDLSEEDKEMFESIFENMMPYIFDYKLYEMTSYEFYDTLGLVE